MAGGASSNAQTWLGGAAARHRGLDGLRGLAVAGVLAFHSGWSWAGGGFLGVSLFFTLSGYLITDLLLVESARTGRIDLRRFWSRRFLRLLPAAVVTLLIVAVAGPRFGAPSSLGGDIRAAIGYVANWREIFAHRSYSDIFTAPSPTQHFWSLSIEEQFYVFFPLLAAVTLRWGRRWFLGAITALATASVVMSFAVHGEVNRSYFGTDVRVVELLAGALLAFALPLARTQMSNSMPVVSRLAWFGPIALAVLWTQSSLSDWAFGGRFALLAVANVATVIVALGPTAARTIGARPLAWLGRVSYGVYLYHWPLFVWLSPERTGLRGVPLAAVRIGATLVCAWLSARLLERPALAARGTPRVRSALIALSLAAVGALVAAGFVPGQASASLSTTPFEAPVLPSTSLSPPAATAEATTTSVAPSAPGVGSASTTTTVQASTTTTTLAPKRPLVWLAGDSVPYAIGQAVQGHEDRLDADILNLAVPGCDGAQGHVLTRLGYGQPDEPERAARDACVNWPQHWATYAQSAPPDAVVFVLGATTVLDRRIDDDWRSPCDSIFRDWYLADVLFRFDWVTKHTTAQPFLAVAPWADDKAIGIVPNDHKARNDCLDAIYREAVAQRPMAPILDLRSQVCPDGRDAPCRAIRPDGIHPAGDAAKALARWLLQETLRPPP